MTYIDNRSPRVKLQDEYIERVIDGMNWNDMKAYVWDKLDEELTEQVAEYYPDLLEND